ncbi:similar to hypothetical protein MGC35154 [Rattus norvegicus]|uniref:Testis-expressed protein 44 n=2 Tax=Rattus norvegicus TaxID=10116 RepID=TEX44_RAT|nr:testis-expressed protein 44 [Rattus norvegicus]Q5U2Y8.1 RecName: Full=Testis-expressed protein 44 [Rattus norvegicus]AAH85806.1 Similar to hypothetical protein MGC35154 [Rattus norvegicus]EDL75588.1 similar to hypothetical protein MGC35154 [Rattus norvegicus]|eukprot:NP_001019535.1 testis-expressed protein 44 [Rattus norvegicus]
MTTEPLEDPEANSNFVHGLPEASLGNKADENSEDLPGPSEGLDPLPDEVPPEDIVEARAEEDVDQASEANIIATEQDEEQASMQIATSMGQNKDRASMQTDTSTGRDAEPATSMTTSTSGVKEEIPGTPNPSQENLEELTSLLPQDPGILQMFVGFQNPVWDRLAENNRTSRSRTVSPSDSQTQEKTSGKSTVSEGQLEIASNADVPSVLPEDVQTSAGATDPPPSDTTGPEPEPTKSADQEAEDFKALNPESKVRSPKSTSEDLAADSGTPQAPPSPNSPADSPPPSPDSYQVSLGRSRLDPSLYGPEVENDYMRSMTSLLCGGEGSISSLTDILVWSDTATRMGVAMGILASGRSSPADRLQDEGPRLRTVASLFRSARSAFSSGVMAGTSSVLRSVTHLLESVERHTMEGIRSTMRYLNHFTLRWARTGSNSD